MGLTQKCHTDVKETRTTNLYSIKSSEGLLHPYTRGEFSKQTQSLSKRGNRMQLSDLDIDDPMIGEDSQKTVCQNIILQEQCETWKSRYDAIFLEL